MPEKEDVLQPLTQGSDNEDCDVIRGPVAIVVQKEKRKTSEWKIKFKDFLPKSFSSEEAPHIEY